MLIRIIASTLPVAAFAHLALAQPLPTWAIPEICAKESTQGQCAVFEGRARNAVSGGWEVLPEAVKKSCLAAVKSPLDQSWRLLSQCIEVETLKGVDRRAVATAATPAEPVPPPKPAVPTDGIPSPPFSLPSDPPKTQ
jgi:hypothetical protein